LMAPITESIWRVGGSPDLVLRPGLLPETTLFSGMDSACPF
jgi:hypothetical protein